MTEKVMQAENAPGFSEEESHFFDLFYGLYDPGAKPETARKTAQELDAARIDAARKLLEALETNILETPRKEKLPRQSKAFYGNTNDYWLEQIPLALKQLDAEHSTGSAVRTLLRMIANKRRDEADEEFNADAGVWKTIQRGGGVSAGMYRAGYKKRRMESVLEWVDAKWPTEEQSRQEKTTAIAAEYVSARETLNTAVQLLLDLFDSAIVKNDSEQPDPQLEADRMKALRIVTEAFLRTTKLEIQRQPLGELAQLSDGTLLGERHGQAQRASEVFAATDRKTFTGLREILGFLLQPKLDALNLEYIEAGKTRSRQSNGTIVVRRNPEMEQTVTEELQLPARNKLRQLNSWIDQKWPGEKPLVIKRWK